MDSYFTKSGKVDGKFLDDIKLKGLAKAIPLETRLCDDSNGIVIYKNTRGAEKDIAFLHSLIDKIDKTDTKYLQEEINYIKQYNITRVDYIDGLYFIDGKTRNDVKRYFRLKEVVRWIKDLY